MEKLASNSIRESMQGLIAKIGVEKFINNTDISISTLVKLGGIDVEALGLIEKISPFIDKNGLIFHNKNKLPGTEIELNHVSFLDIPDFPRVKMSSLKKEDDKEFIFSFGCFKKNTNFITKYDVFFVGKFLKEITPFFWNKKPPQEYIKWFANSF